MKAVYLFSFIIKIITPMISSRHLLGVQVMRTERVIVHLELISDLGSENVVMCKDPVIPAFKTKSAHFNEIAMIGGFSHSQR